MFLAESKHSHHLTPVLEATHLRVRIVMTRHITRTTLRAAFLGTFGVLLLVTGAGTGVAAEVKKAAAAGNTRFIVLNTVPLASYRVLKNQAEIAAPTSTPDGTLSASNVVAAGDIVTVRFDAAANPFPPAQITSFAADGQNTGCATLRWDTPPAGDYVQRYKVEWGTTPGNYTHETIIERLQVAGSGATSYYSPCGFPAGTYYFVVSAENVFDLWSPRSAETSASITNGNTQGPPIPSGVSVSAPPFTGCATVSWNASGSTDVVG
jgi:hypothetical protein